MLPTAAGVGMGVLVLLVTISVGIARRKERGGGGKGEQMARSVRGGASRSSSRARWSDTRDEEYGRLEEAR